MARQLLGAFKRHSTVVPRFFLGDAIELESSGWTHPRALQICFESAADSKQLFCVRGELAQS